MQTCAHTSTNTHTYSHIHIPDHRVKELKGEEGAQAAWKATNIAGGLSRFRDAMTEENVAKEDCESAGLAFLLS
jgi:hypothetical protein